MTDWQDFEKFVSNILELHNFISFWNVNLTINGSRRQFDVIARKNNSFIGIDCKFWDNKKSKKSGLVKSAKLQKDRCLLITHLFGLNIIPLIVTNKEDLCGCFEGINIVPLNKLNNYLLENY
jgi:Restriction endonuclease